MGGLVNAVSGLISGDYGGGRIDAGLAAQERAARDAQAQLGEVWKRQQELSQPWMQTGQTALTSLANNDFMKNWQSDPGYQFRMNQGTKAIEGSAAARGLRGSGATLKALADYGQNQASQEYGNVYNREYGRLSGLAGFGMNALNGVSGAAQNYGNQMAGVSTGLGNAQAAAQMAHAQGQQNMNNAWLGLAGMGMGALSFKPSAPKGLSAGGSYTSFGNVA